MHAPRGKIVKAQLEKCIHCGQSILRKISKTGATRCQILRLKCTNSISAGSLQRSPDPLAVFKGPTSKGREGETGERKRRVTGKGREGMGGKERQEIEREGGGREGRRGGIGACTHCDFRKSAPMCTVI